VQQSGTEQEQAITGFPTPAVVGPTVCQCKQCLFQVHTMFIHSVVTQIFQC